ncbi:MAG TPA: carbohydrate ABC transporter permease [Actinocrinis sp.]|nr:carbohydrate ABC transporter permease [Actinocrinis sp.]
MAAAYATRSRTLISRAQLSRKSGRRMYWVSLSAVVLIFSLVFLFPLYWMITGGFKPTAELVQNPPSFVPAHPQLTPYRTAWDELHMGRLLLNTLIYAGGALALQLTFCVAAAYSLSKLRPVLGNVILGMMLATMMIPAAILVIPQYLTVLDLPLVHWNLLNTPWVIWLPSVANAFNIFLLKRFFDSIPEDILAAAAIDGASSLRTLRSIVLPMSRPILGVVSIFTVIAVWKDFLWPLLTLTDPGKMTLNVGVNSAAANMQQNVLIAGLAMASLPTIGFFLLFQRNIMSGLTSGAMKG